MTMHTHDGFAPHSHEVRPDHLGVMHEANACEVDWKQPCTPESHREQVAAYGYCGYCGGWAGQKAYEKNDPDLVARADAVADFTSLSGRVVHAGLCTGCEEYAARFPWASTESLCLRCLDQQLDLLAMALREAGYEPGTEVRA